MKRSLKVWLVAGCLAVAGGSAVAQQTNELDPNRLRPPAPRGEVGSPVFLTVASVVTVCIAAVYFGGFLPSKRGHQD